MMHDGKRVLLYTTIGYDGVYVPCAKMLAESVQAFTGSRTKDGRAIEFLVICDTSLTATLAAAMRDARVWFPVHIMPVPDSTTKMAASISKLKVFHWRDDMDQHYDVVMYLDADVLATGDLSELLRADALRPGFLYASKESDDVRDHLQKWWSLGDYTEDDLAHFERTGMRPFNAGCFLMRIEEGGTMAGHFEFILDWIATYDREYFYEQCFMNVYFNRRGIVAYDRLTAAEYVMFPGRGVEYPGRIVHFCNAEAPSTAKLATMQEYWNRFLTRRAAVADGHR